MFSRTIVRVATLVLGLLLVSSAGSPVVVAAQGVPADKQFSD